MLIDMFLNSIPMRIKEMQDWAYDFSSDRLMHEEVDRIGGTARMMVMECDDRGLVRMGKVCQDVEKTMKAKTGGRPGWTEMTEMFERVRPLLDTLQAQFPLAEKELRPLMKSLEQW